MKTDKNIFVNKRKDIDWHKLLENAVYLIEKFQNKNIKGGHEAAYVYRVM